MTLSSSALFEFGHGVTFADESSNFDRLQQTDVVDRVLYRSRYDDQKSGVDGQLKKLQKAQDELNQLEITLRQVEESACS